MKKFFAALVALLLFNAAASAQIVTVQGSGASENAAIKDAKRAAVEKVIGARIQSNSLTVDSELVFDAVQARSAGYVTSCEILSKKMNGGMVEITARVDVADEPGSALMKDVELVMTLNDPRLGVVMEHYGDDGGLTFKKYSTMCEAAIREELIKHGFNHVVDKHGEVDYVIVGQLSVGKAQAVKIPSWRDIGNSDFALSDTGLGRSVATVDCRIKKFDTDEVIGEFQATGEGMDAIDNEVSAQAVALMAQNAAQQVRALFSRAASNIFSNVKLYVKTDDGDKLLRLEEILRQTQGVSNIYIRSFKGGQCVIDVGTDLTPQNLYRVLTQAAADSLPMNMTGFSNITLEITLR